MGSTYEVREPQAPEAQRVNAVLRDVGQQCFDRVHLCFRPLRDTGFARATRDLSCVFC